VFMYICLSTVVANEAEDSSGYYCVSWKSLKFLKINLSCFSLRVVLR
jgi:hypothetical protein